MKDLDLSVQLTGIELARARIKATPKMLKNAQLRGIKKTIRGVRTSSSKKVRERYALKASEIKSRVNIKNPKGSQAVFRGVVTYSDRAIPLELYGNPRQGKKGVSVTVEKAKGRTMFKSAFFRKDKEGIWKRVSAGATTGELVARTPIRRLWGPSLASIIRRDLINDIQAEANDTLRKRFREELNYELLKAGR